jgi:hypothetical protein
MQESSPGSVGALDLAIFGMGKEDFPKMPKELYTSCQSWAIKFLKFARDTFGMDFSAVHQTPLNELIDD